MVARHGAASVDAQGCAGRGREKERGRGGEREVRGSEVAPMACAARRDAPSGGASEGAGRAAGPRARARTDTGTGRRLRLHGRRLESPSGSSSALLVRHRRNAPSRRRVRNYSVGSSLAQGKPIDMGKAFAEGVKTSLALHILAEQLGVTMPICESVFKAAWHNYQVSWRAGGLQGMASGRAETGHGGRDAGARRHAEPDAMCCRA